MLTQRQGIPGTAPRVASADDDRPDASVAVGTPPPPDAGVRDHVRPAPRGGPAPAAVTDQESLLPDWFCSAVLASFPGGVVVQDVSGSVVLANEEACALLGLTYTQLCGLTPAPWDWSVTTADGHPVTPGTSPGVTAIRTRQSQRDVVLTVHTAHGETRWLDLVVVPIAGGNGQPCAAVTSIRDITGERTREAALRRTEEQFRLTMDHTPIGFALVGLDGRFLRVNRALCQLVGCPADHLRDRTLTDLTHPDDVAEVTHQVRRLLRGERDSVELEKRYLRHDGDTMWGLLSITLVRDDQGAPLYLIVQIQDITDSRRTHDLLAHLALHDPLTGLPNRTLVLDRVQKALDRGRRTAQKVAVLFCDLDHFKVVNDSMGHELGDAVLVEVSRRLVNALRAGDTAGRLGGDEFVVVCEGIGDEREAIIVAERMQAAVGEPAAVAGRVVVPTMSIGIAVSSSPDVDPLTLLRDADTAMYRAKDQGRNQWDIMDVALRQRALDRLDIEHALRAGLEEGQLALHFQPIVDLRTGHTVGREALLRWAHPERGLLLPDQFLQVAEESGLIGDIGRWVLEQAAWAAAGAADRTSYVAVNVSPHQIARPGLADAVGRALSQAKLPPDRLVVELTESVVLSAAPTSRNELQSLDDLGVRIVVDDFGTGFSALSYLRDLPVSGIKVDRSFTAGLGSDHQCERIVEALTGLGRGLAVDVVVEGVETDVQRSLLSTIGCEHAQGFLFGRPVPEFA
jgi:diguanylate cyclase (GGDEF)-like protein/PAS domain S-box-containing protein